MMKRSSLVQVVGVLALAWFPLTAAAIKWTYLTGGGTQWAASGDVNGDGDLDAILVDQATGVVTIGIRAPDGTLAFRAPVLTGLPNVSGVAVGRFVDANRSTVMLTAPDANRLLVVDAAATNLKPQVTSSSFGFFHGSRLPLRIAATDLGAPGLEDIGVMMGRVGGTGFSYARLGLVNDGTGSFGAPGQFVTGGGTWTDELLGWHPVEEKRGTAPSYIGYIEKASPSVFHMAIPTDNAWGAFPDVGDPGTHSHFVIGQFDSADTDVFFYTPGSKNLRATRVLGTGSFRAPSDHVFPEPIQEVFRLSRGTSDRLLVLDVTGTATVYSYVGNGHPSDQFAAVETIDLSGRDAGAAIPLAGGDFMLLSADSAGGPLNLFDVIVDNGAGYTTIQSKVPLPSTSALPSLGGNVFLFSSPPLVTEGAFWLGSYSVGDWSSQLKLSPTPEVTGERFLDATQGLGSPQLEGISPLPAGALGGLANQHASDISFANLSSAPAVLGEESGGVQLDPPPGEYADAVLVQLSDPNGVGTVLARTDPSSNFGSMSSVWLTEDTTLEAYVLTGGALSGSRSQLVRGTYTFTRDPSEQDQDGDDVPDFVEIEEGLDPNGGPDSDGDGFTDWEELLAGTLPNDPNSRPDPATRPDTAAKLLLTVTPRPWDGTVNQATHAEQGVEVTCHDVGAGLLGAALTDQPVGQPAAELSCDPFDAQQRLLVVSTPTHYPIDTPNGNKRIGREMVGLVRAPDPGRLVWETQTLDETDNSGSYASLAISPVTGEPSIAYTRFDPSFVGSLQYAEFNGAVWTITEVDGNPATTGRGQYCSLAFTASGDPAISYLEGSPDNNLRYAVRSGGVWAAEVVDSAPSVGRFTSLAMLPSGHPAIAYQEFSARDLKYAFFDGAQWQSWTAASTGRIGTDNSMAVDPATGLPTILSYRLDINAEFEDRLQFLEINGQGQPWAVTTIDDNLPNPSLTVGRGGSLKYHPVTQLPSVSYGGSDLWYGWFDGTDWQRQTVTTSSVGATSLAFHPVTLMPVIAYYDSAADDLALATFDGASWQMEVLDANGDVGDFVSLAFDSAGIPHIAYYDSTNETLKYASRVPAPLPGEVAFVYDSSATASAESVRWIAAAQAAQATAGPVAVSMDLDVDDVLALLLTEARIGQLLFFRGIGSSVDLPSFTAFRPGEAVNDPFAQPLTPEGLLSLETVPDGFDPEFSAAIRVRELHEQFEDLLHSPMADQEVLNLKIIAREVYRISSAFHDADPSIYPSPFDALRSFVRMGYLDVAYSSQIQGLTEIEVSEVGSYLFNLTFQGGERSKITVDLVQGSTASLEGLTLAERPAGGEVFSLLDARGRPFELPEAFDLLPGTAFRVVGFDDLGPAQIPHPIEVIAIQLNSVPLPSVNDTDANLLSDEWERLFFGTTGVDPLSSPDGSGYSLLQQFLEGTDPTNGSDIPSGPVADFSFGLARGEIPAEGQFVVEFSWPGGFGEAFDFVIEGSDDLVGFVELPSNIVDLGGGNYRATVNLPQGSTLRFFRAAIRLR